MLNFRSREMSENPKGFLMSAKRLEQVALATKTAFVFRSRFTKLVCSLNSQNSLVELGKLLPKLQTLGFDLWHIAQSGEGLDQTENTQPVLLTASIALWRLWLDLGGLALNTLQVTL